MNQFHVWALQAVFAYNLVLNSTTYLFLRIYFHFVMLRLVSTDFDYSMKQWIECNLKPEFNQLHFYSTFMKIRLVFDDSLNKTSIQHECLVYMIHRFKIGEKAIQLCRRGKSLISFTYIE